MSQPNRDYSQSDAKAEANRKRAIKDAAKVRALRLSADGLSATDIGVRLGWSPTVVASWLRQAKRQAA